MICLKEKITDSADLFCNAIAEKDYDEAVAFYLDASKNVEDYPGLIEMFLKDSGRENSSKNKFLVYNHHMEFIEYTGWLFSKIFVGDKK